MDLGSFSHLPFPRVQHCSPQQPPPLSFTHLLPGSHGHCVSWGSLLLCHATRRRKSGAEGAELLQLPTAQTRRVSCSSDDERDRGGESLGKAEGRWRCSRAGHCRARLGDEAAPSGRKMGVTPACVAPASTESSGVMHIWNCDTAGVAVLIADTDIRRKMAVLLPPRVAHTLKKGFGALDSCLMGDAFRNGH